MGKKKNYDNGILTTNVTNEIFMNSGIKNEYSYVMYFNRLLELAVSVFKWNDLPETCDERYLELTLLSKGHALFFKDEIMGYLGLPCTYGGRLDVYGIPINREAYSANGNYRMKRDTRDSVLIYNNELHSNDYVMIEYYAQRLWFIDQIIDINTNAQKTPVLLIGDQKQKLTLKNLYQKYDGNAPVIFGDNSLTTSPISAISTGAPFVADKLYQIRTNIWNEALTFIGVSNVSIEKKERVIKDEIQQLNGGTVSGRYSRLLARKQACDKINRMFPDLHISVDVREDVEGKDVNPPEKPNAENSNVNLEEGEGNE